MKVWEETWEAELHGNACDCSSRILQKDPAPTIPDDEVLFYVQDGGRANAMGRRARLAAAAPEMARLLMEMLEERYGKGPYPPDHPCRGGTIFQVLRKAGVRE